MVTKYSPLKAVLLIFILFYACSSDTNKQTKVGAETPAKIEEKTSSNAAKNAYFGDLHIHTSWSFDAFVFNVKIDPDDAYRFGKGEAIDHIGGKKIKPSKINGRFCENRSFYGQRKTN